MNAMLFHLDFSSKIIIFHTIYFHLIFQDLLFQKCKLFMVFRLIPLYFHFQNPLQSRDEWRLSNQNKIFQLFIFHLIFFLLFHQHNDQNKYNENKTFVVFAPPKMFTQIPREECLKTKWKKNPNKNIAFSFEIWLPKVA